jgi:peroxiredoxin
MKKQTIITIGLMILGLSVISLLTINNKKAFAVTSDNQIPSYQIGSIVSDFSLKNYDGNMISLSGDSKAQGYILVFTCNHCPYAKAYQSRIVDLDKKYRTLGYPVLAINPNKIGDDGEDNATENKATATEKGFTFPYLRDENQAITTAFGAKRTPTAYVLKKDGNQFILKYAGAIDDNSQSAESVTKKYVEMAINELLLGKNVSLSSTKSIGCGIKWKDA